MTTIPALLEVTCTADDRPQPGLFVSVSLRMCKKNDHHMVFGPSDDRGKIDISRDDMMNWVKNACDLFPMDYADLSGFGGEIQVDPMGPGMIESAMKGFEMYGSIGPFPSGYANRLAEALETLVRMAPQQLGADAEVVEAAGRIDAGAVREPSPPSQVPVTRRSVKISHPTIIHA